MAKIVVHHNEDPAIGIVLEYTAPGDPRRAQGWRGECTQCGFRMHRWNQKVAISSAQRHVDAHPAHV